jgi:hypothetical protein
MFLDAPLVWLLLNMNPADTPDDTALGWRTATIRLLPDHPENGVT